MNAGQRTGRDIDNHPIRFRHFELHVTYDRYFGANEFQLSPPLEEVGSALPLIHSVSGQVRKKCSRIILFFDHVSADQSIISRQTNF